MTERACIDCGEPTLNPERCRECDIQYILACMQCSGCKQMRYRTDDERFSKLSAALWGDPCTCDPKPPSVYEAEQTR